MNVSRRGAFALAGLGLMGLVGVRITAPTDALAGVKDVVAETGDKAVDAGVEL